MCFAKLQAVRRYLSFFPPEHRAHSPLRAFFLKVFPVWQSPPPPAGGSFTAASFGLPDLSPFTPVIITDSVRPASSFFCIP